MKLKKFILLLLFLIPTLLVSANDYHQFFTSDGGTKLTKGVYRLNRINEAEESNEKIDHLFKDGEIVATLNPLYSKEYRSKSKSLLDIFGKQMANVEIEKSTCITNYDNISEITLAIPLKKHGKEEVLQAINSLNKNECVSYAGPNYINKVAYTPNDPELENQWSISNNYSSVGAKLAWDTTRGNKRVRVGIIDTGITDHEDLLNNRAEGRDFINNNTTTNESFATHGTHVAGIACAVANNSIGISGIASNVTIVPLQCSEDGVYLNSGTVVQAINYATSLWGTENQISVLNYSVDGFGWDMTVLNAVKNFPGLFVWCAYNSGMNVDEFSNILRFNCENIISVGAMNDSLQRRVTSNYGDGVTIYAPGEDILSCGGTSSYVSMSGTSMAAPHITGTAALLYSKYPNLTVGEVKRSIVESATSVTISTPDGDDSVKYLSVNEALSAVPTIASINYAYLRMSVTGKSGTTWSVKIINDNNVNVHVVYNSKMCLYGDATNFSNLIHVQDTTISANWYKTVSISENGWATSIVAAITFSHGLAGNRFISYTDGLSDNNGSYSTSRVRNNYQTQDLNFSNTTSLPSYLSLQVIGRTGFIFYNWTIRVFNNTNRLIDISYNSKMCFELDAKTFTLADIVERSIDSYGSVDVTIVSNGFADYISASVNYSYYGFDLRRVTYANGLGQNGGVCTIGTNKHSLIRYQQNGGNVHEN